MNKIHFIAVGGSAMHNLALALLQKGYTITGSDDALFEPSKSRLAKAGILPEELGWFPEKINADLDAVILGMHAKKDNPELIKAQEIGVPIFSYPEFLYQQSQDKTRVVIAGSHGKTTVTAMVLHVLNYYDIAVDFMVGAQLEGFDTMVHLTEENDFMLIEGDEYLSSPLDLKSKFLWYQPHLTLITGIAWDHVNVFPTEENYIQQFEKYIETIVPGGTLVYNSADKRLAQIVEATDNTIRKESYASLPHFISEGITYLETSEGDLPLEIFGEHNLSNLAGAKWICQLMGVDEMDFFEAITSFKGAAKRLQKEAQGSSAFLFKDFAHAPSKVMATTQAVADQFSSHKKLFCLELHTYSSLNPAFIGNYAESMKAADLAVVYFDPAALKIKNLPPITKDQIKAAFNQDALYVFDDPKAFETFLLQQAVEQTVVLMMSSGNYGGLNWEALREKITLA